MPQESIARYFEQDHARLDRLFGTFRASKQSDRAAAEHTYRQFALGLTRHIAWEEHILFPVFEAKTGLQHTGPAASWLCAWTRPRRTCERVGRRSRNWIVSCRTIMS